MSLAAYASYRAQVLSLKAPEKLDMFYRDPLDPVDQVTTDEKIMDHWCKQSLDSAYGTVSETSITISRL